MPATATPPPAPARPPSTPSSATRAPQARSVPRPPLARHGVDRPVAGVAAGVARHLGLPTGAVRWGFALLTLAGGAGAVLYAWLWLLLPDEAPGGAPHARPAAASTLAARLPEAAERLRGGGWPLLLAAVLLGVGGIVVADGLGITVDWALVGPVAVLVIGLGLAWMQLDLSQDPGRARTGRLVRLVLGTGLVLLAVLAIAVGSVGSGELWLGLVVAVALLAGTALVAMPYVLAWQRRRDEERTALAVHAERAEMAAHLHDSVLQSLALIQRRADDPETVARVARSQERRLRGFLFPAAAGAQGSLREMLEAEAAAVEDAHGRRVEVVAVGDASGAWLEPLVAAAREAVLNAARHAGDVQVFAEVSESDDGARLAEVFVRDRGAGFDLDAVPADRRGVRGSILGRMRRAGGTARIRSGPTGTEVHLSLADPAGRDAA